MSLAGAQPMPLASLGAGLNLRDKPDVVTESQALDLLNVEFGEQGSVRQRAGFLKHTASALTNPVDSMAAYYESAGTRQLLCGCGTRLEALDTAGAVVASAAGLTSGPYTFVRFGAPNAEVAYAGNGIEQLRKWDGAAWTLPTATVNGAAGLAMPRAGAVCLMSTDNRLVATGFTTTTGGPNGTTSSPSHVYFSNPGLPETWETDGTAGRGRNFVQLTPGDGERIMAAVTWRELVFVFKESKFFVFTGNGTANDGTPIFNYRPVDNGQGLASARAIAVGRDGVYFMSRRGVYRTTGGEPQLISNLIDPIWLGGASAYFESGVLNHEEIDKCAMTWHNERVYLAYPSGAATTNDRVLVYDTQLQWWSLYDFPAATLATFRASDQIELVFGYSSGTNDVGRHGETSTSDAGVAITSRWRHGWIDFNDPSIKRIRRSEVSGTGTITVRITKDHDVLADNDEEIVFTVPLLWGDGSPGDWLLGDGSPGDAPLGPANQVTDKWSNISIRGRKFSTRFHNDRLDTAWSVHGLIPHVIDVRVPSASNE